MKTLPFLGLLMLSAGVAAQDLPGAHGPASRIDCPPMTVAYRPPPEQLRWPTHSERRIPNPFEVNVRCAIGADGLLSQCSAFSLQEHSLRDLGFIERFATHVTVTDEPRPCGQMQLTFAIPEPVDEITIPQ